MTTLLVSDIHMTEQARDSYRWGLFPWLAKQAQVRGINQVIILGDCTDKKDRHSASLVNRMCDALAELSSVCPVYIIAGNHDFVEPSNPFFRFVNAFPRVRFFTAPEALMLPIAKDAAACLFLPCSADPYTDWEPLDEIYKHRYIFTHQTFVGSMRENGTRSDDGIPATFFEECGFKGEAYAGDIHVPQKIGGVTYIGAPYRIDFGDRYEPRVLLINKEGTKTNLRFPCPSKHLVEINEDGVVETDGGGVMSVDIRQGDQVKVRATLKRADFPLWPGLQKNIRDMAAKGKWVLFGPELRRADVQTESTAPVVRKSRASPEALLRQYGQKHGLEQTLLEVGVAILAEA